eukprot:CAMPEP_0182893898 /NCGR_PEP_ID=MMETSP0034_2-20130328/24753_1 /TAXON_ID=156128 /ORGANISM="Nephroselmis pyriformis, Strain CCMP717" /LENGTH=66 /DNA_ID=CAMNT_0025027659 /DNA_START=445 /DNA_END=642 /DNA_ORIENTATION=-
MHHAARPALYGAWREAESGLAGIKLATPPSLAAVGTGLEAERGRGASPPPAPYTIRSGRADSGRVP